MAPLRAQDSCKLEDLPSFESELAGRLAALDDRELEKFSWEVFLEENYRKAGIQVRDWNTICETVRSEVDRRARLSKLFVDLTWQHAASRLASADHVRARQLLALAEERAEPGSDRLAWIFASLAQVDALEERWTACRDNLARADLELERARDRPGFEVWIDGLRASLWLSIGMPELAQEYVDRQWQAASLLTDANSRFAAFEVRYEYFRVSNDFDGLRDFEQSILESDWYAGLGQEARASLEFRFALALVEEGLLSTDANRAARTRLNAVITGGLLTPPDQATAWFWLAIALIDAGMVDDAVSAAAHMRILLDSLGSLDPLRQENVAARRLLVAEAQAGLLRAERGRPDPEALARHLEQTLLVWNSLRKRWSEVPTRDGGIGYLFLSNRQFVVQTMLGLELAVKGPTAGAKAAFERLIEAHLESTLVKRMGVQACDFALMRLALLGRRRGLVVWIPLRGRSYALAADGSRVQAFELPGVDVLERRASELAAGIQRSILGHEPANSKELEGLLQAAQGAFLPAQLQEFLAPLDSVYLVGLDDAGFVPFELLDSGDGTTQGARRAVCRLPSIPVGVDLVQRAKERGAIDPTALLVIADKPSESVAQKSGLEALRIPPALLRQFGRSLEPLDCTLRSGSAASIAALQFPPSARPGFTHVVGHGIRRMGERPPGILLAPLGDHSGEVYAEDIEALQASDMVLLSVCGAARSRLRRGDGGRSDLSASFFLAGAYTVGSSPAELDLVPTLRVGISLHEQLLSGATLAEGMRLVRQAALQGGKKYDPESLCAHLIQVSGAGMTAHLEPVSRSSAGPPSSMIWGVATGCCALAAVLIWHVKSRRRS